MQADNPDSHHLGVLKEQRIQLCLRLVMPLVTRKKRKAGRRGDSSWCLHSASLGV